MELVMNRRNFVVAAAGCAVALAAVSGVALAANKKDDEAAEPAMEGEISVYSREDGSGTRGAFIELLGIEQKDEDGNKVDMTTIDAAITNSTSVMMTTVASDDMAIGYISLGSLNDTVKAVKVDGVEATAENVKSGDYAVARPFNIVTVEGGVTDLGQDFIDFIMSAGGQAIVEENGYVAVVEQEDAETYAASGMAGKIVVAGSSSVAPVMEKLAEAYEALNADVNVEVQTSDSTTGVNMALEGTCEIGMASRELKDSEVEKDAVSTVIAQDGIAVIVNPDAPIDELTSYQIRCIYTGEVTDWEDVLVLVDPEAEDEAEDKVVEGAEGATKEQAAK